MRAALNSVAPAFALAPVLLLAACGDKAPAPERKAASGEILGGEVSDAMIPLDSVRSTSPADPRAGSGDNSTTDASSGGAAGSDTASARPSAPDAAPEAPPAPAPEPEAEPT